MSITISDGVTAVDLHPDLLWSDEFNWNPVEQTAERTITGAMVVSAATRVAGRPITLEPQDDSSAWISRSTIAQLRNWCETPGRVLSLTLRGATRDVIFRHHDGTAVEAKPVVHFADVQDLDWYRLTLRLMEI